MARDRAKKELSSFMDFVRQQGVVGIAVGLAVGVAAANAVREVVDGLISPIVGFILAGTELSEITWNTGLTRHGVDLVFAWGSALNGIIILLATAFIIYIIVHKFRLDRLDKKKD